ncbi:hypothetical protein [Pseudoalteromonas luteoviolacea]|uniref:Uncharacterized protein n=1 Tax=Pseudoalteromonas luteoviolacea DSM 6061 TaxID=1365250 RepID=A0A161XY42_9GAMM|nr:hypothetical protein [Pseudoalteromonas luteoviolacea]KZN39748.1 hypothetical protein N475_13390 [Pseudoalteromonas luteoviolacea DSM 6061]KZN55279.1 hypothetical protein N474_14940 [Pseudoalteromonas luteoviolacea CPMOR-2]MBE0385684.1 hypothetical protein [Pseudoalteromonas luteoviolacea DSM 6061]TQF70667.1 hypothetical protein FLM44_06140 [Pseudoalteromonas luteoviolacea]
MDSKKQWKSMSVVGAVLVANGVVFSIIALSLQSFSFWGPALGCVGAGIPLLVLGLSNQNKSKAS